MSSILEFGIKKNVVVRNVAKLTAVPKSEHREHVTFAVADIEAFIAASAGTQLGTIILFALGTGLRRGEICGLLWNDVKLESGVYSLQRAAKNVKGKAVIGDLKTPKSRRTDHMPSFVVQALREHRIEQMQRHSALGIRPPDGGFVFADAKGQMVDPNELSGAFGNFVRNKGLRHVRFHDLRHAYATNAFAAGVSLKVISESLGHSNIGITSEVYTAVLDPAKIEKSNVLDGYLGSAVVRGLRSGTTEA